MLEARVSLFDDFELKNKVKIDDDLKTNSFLSPKNAAFWASEYLGKNVTTNNIIYLINYGKIANYGKNPKENLIDKNELKAYYDTTFSKKNELLHPLSFSNYKEAQTTKHIHRLHPYKGKFIPQLVEYFLDTHTDELKTQAFFKRGDFVLDLFCGSGTTLAVANELGLNAVGIELSSFNTMLCNAKIKDYDLNALKSELSRLICLLENFNKQNNIAKFEQILSEKLSEFNQIHFPNKEFKRRVALKQIDEKAFGEQKELEFLPIFRDLADKFKIQTSPNKQGSFFEKWYIPSIRDEILLLKEQIGQAPQGLEDILSIILSRTARSCRATTHSDLATLNEPMTSTYFCAKHGRVCKPLFSITKWFKSYANDTLKRLAEFKALKTPTKQLCINANSTNCDILSELSKKDKEFANLLERQKFAGIFSSPPYVGLIDYHEQHAYAYDIFNLPRKDECEIGALKEGQGKLAQEKYTQNIAQALLNAKPFLAKNYKIFLVANDKFNLYPSIAKLANMKITKRYERPVLNRSEKDKGRYNESIFLFEES